MARNIKRIEWELGMAMKHGHVNDYHYALAIVACSDADDERNFEDLALSSKERHHLASVSVVEAWDECARLIEAGDWSADISDPAGSTRH